MTDRSFTFVSGSAREGHKDSNSTAYARRAAQGLPTGAVSRWIDLRERELPDFTDPQRSSGDPYTPRSPAERELLRETLEPTDLVIVSPLYWYSLSSSVKRYLDYWSSWLRVPEVDFRETMSRKTLWGITVMAEKELERSEALIRSLELTADYLGMRWGGAIVGVGSRPGEVLDDKPSLDRADGFFSRLGEKEPCEPRTA